MLQSVQAHGPLGCPMGALLAATCTASASSSVFATVLEHVTASSFVHAIFWFITPTFFCSSIFVYAKYYVTNMSPFMTFRVISVME